LISPPGDSTEIYIVGKQWMWKAQHPEGSSEINDLHVPLGRPVKLTMSSQDVIHSYYIPAFRVKQDVMPGKYTSLWFNATKPGKFRIFCTEYCGSEHSRMGGWVTVLEPAEYESWLESGPRNAAMAVDGERLFKQYHCSGCHGGDSNTAERAVVRAPNLEGVFGGPVPIQVGDKVELIKADERYVRDSILQPTTQVVAGYKPLMPSFAGQISEDDLLKIMAYIKSIGRGTKKRHPEDRGEELGEEALPEITKRMGVGR
jgi:cytochrome c oxidase subunit II